MTFPTCYLKAFPSITIPLSFIRPIFFAIVLAVNLLSPVTILTLIPALYKCFTDFEISSLIVSFNPKIPIKQSFSSSITGIPSYTSD